MEQVKTSTINAGIDVGKFKLDVAIGESAEAVTVNNDAAGIAQLVDWLTGHGVSRVGMEATGGV
jgi:transposase